MVFEVPQKYQRDFFGNPVRDLQTTPRRKKGGLGFMGKLLIILVGILLAVVVSAPFALLGGWALMLAVGIIHLHVLSAVQPVGYWLCVALAFLLRVAVGATTNTTTKE